MLKKLLKITATFLMIATCISMISCRSASNDLLKHGDEIVSIINEKINSDKYLSLVDAPAAYRDEVDKLRLGNYSEEMTVYQLHLSEKAYYKMIYGTELSKDEFSETLYNSIKTISSGYIAAIINSKGGVSAVSTATFLNASITFADTSIKENLLFLYVFKSGAPILISMEPGDGGAIHATGNIIISNGLDTGSAESVKKSFEHFGFECVSVDKVR